MMTDLLRVLSSPFQQDVPQRWPRLQSAEMKSISNQHGLPCGGAGVRLRIRSQGFSIEVVVSKPPELAHIYNLQYTFHQDQGSRKVAV